MNRPLLHRFVAAALLCLCTGMYPLYAQEFTQRYTSRGLTTKHGLADMTIWSLFRDSHGYLWAGTKGGISRWDGNTFRNYYISNGLTDNSGNDITEAGSDTISILTRYGISFITGDSISSYRLPGGVSSDYWSYQAVQAGKIYLFNLLTNSRSRPFLKHYCFDLATKKFSEQTVFTDTDIIKTFTNRHHIINVFTRNGKWYTINQGRSTYMAQVADSLLDICSFNDSSFYYYDLNRQGFYQLTLTGRSFNSTRQISYPHDGYSFKRNMTATSTGDVYFNNNNDTIFRIRRQVMEPIIVNNDAYYDMMADDRTGLWLGSYHGLITYHHFYFQEYLFNKDKNGMVINVLQDNNGRTWLSGHNNGIWYLDNGRVRTVEATAIRHMNGETRSYYPIQYKGAAKLADGRLYFPFEMGIVEVHQQTYTCHYRNRPYINYMVPDATGTNLYIGTGYGLMKFDPQQGYRELFFANGYNNAPIYYLYTDQQQNTWAFTQYGAGIIRHDTIYPVKNLEPYRVLAMEQDAAGKYWIGTLQGLYCFEKDKPPYQVGASLFKGEVKALLTYDADNLVVADNRQVAILHNYHAPGEQENWIVFNDHTGYPGEDMLGNNIFKDANNNIWLLNENKVVTCNPSEILKKRQIPDVFINSFQASGDYINWNDHPVLKETYHLTADNRNVKIGFLSVYLNDPQGVVYQYRLQGLNNNWSPATPVSYVMYANLPPGNYLFEVRVSADGIQWNRQTASVRFHVAQYWWQTAWFYAVAVIMLLGCGWLLSKYYIRSKMKKAMRRLEKQLAIEQERHRISSEIHDDLGAGLSGIRLQAELATHKATTPEMKAEFGRLYGVASELSAKMREVIWSLNTENDNLDKLLYYVRQEAFKLFEHSTVQLRFLYPDDPPLLPVSGHKRRNIHLIVKEALHNTIKHAQATSVWVEASIAGGILAMSVRDNGRGLPADAGQPQDGNGIRNMQQRAVKSGGELSIRSGADGTTVLFTIAVQQLAK
jgi:signal transduction histidine kinase/ligand-binding sensor domain-containing protein